MERDTSSSPVPNGKTRGLRVTFADSPNGSRPASNLGWNELRAETPPLAGEWSASSTAASTAASSSTSASLQNNGAVFSQKSQAVSAQAKSFQSQQMSSSSFQSSQSSSFSSKVQKSSFSSSQSSSIQASKAFEAFPGLGGIESLKIE